ncbi:MAG: chorismate mutase [Myxococcota bacterium]|nr:chorismate mutase [Myxococcota bacterium]
MGIPRLRAEIDVVNLELLELLARRGRLVEQIALQPKDGGRHDPEREEAQVRLLLEKNPGPYPDELIAGLFRKIFRASLELKLSTQRRRTG